MPSHSNTKGSSNILIIVLSVMAVVLAGTSVYLYAQNTSLNSQVNTLTANYNALQSNYSTLNNNYNALSTNFNALSSEKLALDDQVDNLNSQLTALNASFILCQNNYTILMNAYEECILDSQGQASFAVESSTHTGAYIRNTGTVSTPLAKVYVNNVPATAYTVSGNWQAGAVTFINFDPAVLNVGLNTIKLVFCDNTPMEFMIVH